jgi:Stress up-regulated Nod 19
MNSTPKNITTILTIDYEFIPASPYPVAFRNLTSVWLDVGGCDDSDVPVQGNSTFTLSTPSSWTMPASDLYRLNAGRIVFAEGHLHDAGTHIEILKNSDESICDSIATYGATPGFVEKDLGMQHISNMTSCGGDVPSPESNIVKAGDRFDLRAHYDMTTHKGMRESDGTLAPVMGIAIMYLAPGES